GPLTATTQVTAKAKPIAGSFTGHSSFRAANHDGGTAVAGAERRLWHIASLLRRFAPGTPRDDPTARCAPDGYRLRPTTVEVVFTIASNRIGLFGLSTT